MVRITPATEPAARGLLGVMRVVELRDGRVALLEGYRPSLTVVEVDAGVVHRIGRRGTGPGEFENPSALLVPHLDTLMVVERLGRRFHLFSTSGTFLRSAILPGGITYATADLHADTLGRVYVVNRGDPRRAIAEGADSATVLRLFLTGSGAEPVWALHVGRLWRMPTLQGHVVLPEIFGAVDHFGITVDGRMIRAVVNEQQLYSRANGVTTRLGPRWAIPQQRVRAQEQDSARSALEAAPLLRGVVPRFADDLAVVDQMAIAPDGEIWLRLTVREASGVVWRIHDPEGTPRRDALLPLGMRLVGIGRTRLYLAVEADSATMLFTAPRPGG